jgi:hypothetical protein
MDKSKNIEKINLNNENNNNKQNLIYKNESQKEKEDNKEIIIKLEIFNETKENENIILCDINELIIDKEINEDYYEENNINTPKEFNYFY